MARPQKKPPKDEEAPQADDRLCFVIMPFGGPFDRRYQRVFRPAIEAAGLLPKRADDLHRPGAITDDIWNLTKQAEVILADLTGLNSNVLYELGLAHAIAKPAILVTDSIENVPFDLRALRLIEYDRDDPEWGSTIAARITKAIHETVSNPKKAVLPAFLEVPERRDRIVTENERILLQIAQDLELLKYRVSGSSPVLHGLPTLKLSPDNGLPSTPVVLEGHGFAPDDDVTVAFGGLAGAALLTDSIGSFSVSIDVPLSLPPGFADVRAIDLASGATVVRSFFVNSPSR